MAGVMGVRNIAAAAGVDPQEVLAMLHSGGDMRLLACRATARLVEERRSDDLETAAAAKLDLKDWISSLEIH